jgi:amino acid adenylation domain-containing protein
MPSIAETIAARSAPSPSWGGADRRDPLDGLEKQRASWEQDLDGPFPVLDLPTDRPRPAVPSYRGAQRRFALDGELSLALRELSRREGVTLFETTLAAFQVLLSRYSRQADIVVGVPFGERGRVSVLFGERGCVSVPSLGALTQLRSLEGQIELFPSVVPIRTQLSGNPTFRELLGRVAETVRGAHSANGERGCGSAPSLGALTQPRSPEDTARRRPLFQVLFSLHDAPPSPLEFREAAVNPTIEDKGRAGFDLALALVHDRDELHGTLEYNSDLFETATIDRLLGHFQVLLAGIVSDPEQRLSALPLLTEAERQLLLVEWNRTEADFPSAIGVHELFEAQVEKTPEAIALIFADQQLTYAELNARANQLAGYLRQLGAGPETLVGLAVERSLELVLGILGVLKAGGAYVPLDPAYPKERLAFLMQDSQIPILLTQKRLLSDLPAHQAHVVCLDADWEIISRQSTANPAHTVSGENLAYVIYTSGSTGKPKGIMVPHRGLVNYLTWCVRAYGAEAGTGAPVCSSISFDLTITSLFSPLLAGRAVEIFPPCRDVELLREAFRTPRDYSLIKITPAHLELLSKQISADEAPGRTRAFIIGGENLTARQIAFWQEHAPDTLLVNEYGPTETVVGCCIYQVPRGGEQGCASAPRLGALTQPRSPETKSASIPIGRPIANTQLYVLDAHLQPVPLGVPGELYIGGAGLARGYLNRPELTAERFIPHPFRTEPGARLYRTGDLVRWLPDGNLEFLGRLDQQIKLRGFRIEPGEIEAALTEHPFVREAVVIVREDRPGNKRLVAYLVPRSGERGCVSAPSSVPADLRNFLEQKLPTYMVPSAFVVLPRLPLTPNSKVDRRALPAPEMDRPELASAYAAPRTPVEETLAGIWKALLGMDRVGVHDDFFELGGDSLLAVELFAQVEKIFGSKLPLATLFQRATIEQLAALVHRPGVEPVAISRGAPSPLPRTEVVEIQPGKASGGADATPLGPALFFVPSVGCELLYCQAIAKYLGPRQPVYGIQPCSSNGRVQQPASVEAIAAEYIEALRAFQPEGPYALAGYSFAGMVAFEMARQLAALGARVQLLAIIDSSPSRPSNRSGWEFLPAVVASVLNLPLWLKDDFFQTHPREMVARLRRHLRAARRRLFGPSSQRPERSELEILFDVGRLPDHYRDLIEANLRASRCYVPKPYAGRLTLFRARTQPFFCGHRADLGWSKFARGGVATHIIPGTHDSILKEPHVKTLAEGFRAALSNNGH